MSDHVANNSDVVIEINDNSLTRQHFPLDENASEFSDTPLNPREEPWTDETEQLVRRWAQQMEALSELHDNAGYLVKTRYYRLAIPGILIPFVMGFVSQVLPEGQTATITDGAMFMVTSGLVGLQALFGYGQLYEQHFFYSSHYSNIVSRIESELSRRRKFRTPADVFITELKCTINNLNDNAPELPMGCC